MGPTPRRILLSYSMGSIGTGLYLTVPSILLLYYLTQILGISPALAGLAVFLPRIWDVVTDPVMGWVSDRTRSRLGRRRPYLLIGAILTSLTFGFLFSAPVFPSQAMSFVYVLVIYVLSATAYTVYAVPYLSMPAEMSADSSERSRIMSYRMTFAMVGVLAGSALAPALLEFYGGGRAGFAAMSWTIGTICAVTMLLAFFGTARSPDVSAPAEDEHSRGKLSDLRKDPDFLALALAYIAQLAGFGVFMGATPYYVTDVTGQSEGVISEMFLSLMGGTVMSLFVWNILATKMGKARAYMLAGVIVAIGFVFFWLTALDGQKAVTLAATLIIGIGFGGLQLLPFAMLTDVIHAARLRGRDSAGVYTGAWTAVEKGGLALGPLIVGGVLSLGGYVSASETQGSDTVAAIRAAMTLVPAVFVLISIPIMFRCNPAHRADEMGIEALSP
ncbi:MFS transporter [Hyphomonas sp. GM-8P]|uniref:MFS transporter n=1 Tax=Hyphomonas sp. GM-8P TaxID=1280945 RepID=UPI0013146230|nr:MFS transporter [Hyphomonas sp. GM-8P]